jgi:hypothetical protein
MAPDPENLVFWSEQPACSAQASGITVSTPEDHSTVFTRAT